MIIGIDGNEVNVENRVGVNVYAFELLRDMADLVQKEGADTYLIVYLKNQPLPDMPKPSTHLSYRILSGGGMWILTKLMPNLFFGREKPDVFFTPSHYLPPFAPMPKVCSIMDLGYLKNSEQFKKLTFWQLKYWSAMSIFVSKAVITISNSTKDDIVRHYPFAAHRTSVIPLAYDKNKFNLDIPPSDVRRIRKKYHIVGDYILFLSTLKPSKNIEGLLEAFGLISNSQLAIHNLKLVIAGKKGWLYKPIFAKVKELGLEDKVIFTDFVPEEDKPGLINGAKVFVLPSFWEGFGLDLLNAMAAGVPVVASNTGSIPEVVGDAGILVDPKSPESITFGLKKVLSLPKNEYNELISKGLERVKRFSWEKTARKTLEILEKTATK